MRSNYKRLGNYIVEVNVRNSELKAEELLGINIDKFFMPSVANVVGTDLSVYKLVKKSQFACNRMHVGRDYRLPISMSKSDDEFMVSPAYDVFEIKDTEILDPEYLMMWFSRKEFDRNAWFYTDADVRGGLPWKSFCDMQLPVPSITKQREIVKEYNVIQNRIALNQKLIQKLEETAQAIYKQWFFEGSENWNWITIKDFCIEMKSGGTPSRTDNRFWNSKDIPWIKTGEIKNNILIQSEEYISKEGLNNSSAKLLPKDTVLMSMYGVNAGEIGILKFESSANQACCGMICKDSIQAAFLYYHLLHNQKYIASQAIGGAQENLSKDFIEKIEIPLPDDKLSSPILKTIIDNKEVYTRQNQKLSELIDLLLSKLATIEN